MYEYVSVCKRYLAYGILFECMLNLFRLFMKRNLFYFYFFFEGGVDLKGLCIVHDKLCGSALLPIKVN